MIYVILLIDKQDGSIVTASRFYTTLSFTDDEIRDFLIGYRDVLNTEGLAADTPIFVGAHKVFYHTVDEEWLLLLVTDGRDEDRAIQYKVREGASRVSTALRGNSLGYIKDILNDKTSDTAKNVNKPTLEEGGVDIEIDHKNYKITNKFPAEKLK